MSSHKRINVYFSIGESLLRKEQTSIMVEENLKKRAKHFITDLGKGMNFSGLSMGFLKSILFLIGPKDLTKTWRTKVVTLCNNAEEAPLVMLELLQRKYQTQYPELAPHFDAIIKTVKDGKKH